MPGVAFVELPSDGTGICRRCGVVFKLNENSKLPEHKPGGRFLGERCRGTDEDPWDYRG